jgi:hypothetical protein
MSHQVREFAESLKIKLLSSSPYYAQANGQVESSNKTLIKIIIKRLRRIPKGGMKSFLKRYRHIAFPSIVRQR